MEKMQLTNVDLSKILKTVEMTRNNSPIRWSYNLLYQPSNVSAQGGYDTNDSEFEQNITKTINSDIESISNYIPLNPNMIKYDVKLTKLTPDLYVTVTPVITDSITNAKYQDWISEKHREIGIAARHAGSLDENSLRDYIRNIIKNTLNPRG